MNQEKCIVVIPQNKLSPKLKNWRRTISGIGMCARLCVFLFFICPVFIEKFICRFVHFTHILLSHRLQRTNKEGTSSRERTAAFGLIMPGGPPPALPGDHSVLLPSIASQTPMRE